MAYQILTKTARNTQPTNQKGNAKPVVPGDRLESLNHPMIQSDKHPSNFSGHTRYC